MGITSITWWVAISTIFMAPIATITASYKLLWARPPGELPKDCKADLLRLLGANR